MSMVFVFYQLVKAYHFLLWFLILFFFWFLRSFIKFVFSVCFKHFICPSFLLPMKSCFLRRHDLAFSFDFSLIFDLLSYRILLVRFLFLFLHPSQNNTWNRLLMRAHRLTIITFLIFLSLQRRPPFLFLVRLRRCQHSSQPVSSSRFKEFSVDVSEFQHFCSLLFCVSSTIGSVGRHFLFDRFTGFLTFFFGNESGLTFFFHNLNPGCRESL